MAHGRTADRAEAVRMRFRRAPLAAAACWFALGIGASRWVSQPPVVLSAALCILLAIAVFALRSGGRTGWVPVAGLWIVAGLASAQWQPGAAAPGPLVGYADGLSRTVQGRVARVRLLPAAESPSEQDSDLLAEEEDGTSAASGRVLSVDLAVDAVQRLTPDVSEIVPIVGGLRATVYPGRDGTPVPELRCGDRLEFSIRMKAPDRYRDPGVFQYADLLRAQGIAVRGNLDAERIRETGSARGWTRERLRCGVYEAQSWAAQRMSGYAASRTNHHLPPALRLDQADAAMLNAMLFGDRSGLNHELRLGFERTGSFHLFVVSGLHVALLASAVFWVMRRARAPLRAATLTTLVAASAYAMLTGFGQPVQRALAMTALYLLAKLLMRDRESLNALGAAALGMLVWAPSSVFDASFQMTVLAIVAIAGMAIPLAERSFAPYLRGAKAVFEPAGPVPPGVAQLRLMLRLWGEAFERLLGRWAREIPALLVRLCLWTLELALIGTVAELVMVLPMAMYFHRAAVFALPTNMVVIPAIALLAPAAVATFVGSLVSPWLACVPGVVTALLLHAMRAGIARLSHLAVADVRVPGPVWWIGMIAALGWAACCWAVRRNRWGAWGTVAALPLIAALVLWPEPVATTPGLLEVTALDVGQGDSLLVVGPGGRAMLVDAGGPTGQAGRAQVESAEGAATNFDVGEEVVSPYLWSRQVRHLDVVALTHAHSDHMGGMPAILRSFHPRELWVGIDPGSPGYSALLNQAAALGIAVRHLHAGDGFGWDGVQVSVLSPARDYRNIGPAKNDDSLVLRLDFGAGSALLEGDAERLSERTMVAAGLVHPVTLLKVGHHGSLSSTSAPFLAAASPQAAILSAGRGNPFGHPRPEVIARIAGEGARLYRTDLFGLTTFLIGRDGTLRTVLGAH